MGVIFLLVFFATGCQISSCTWSSNVVCVCSGRFNQSGALSPDLLWKHCRKISLMTSFCRRLSAVLHTSSFRLARRSSSRPQLLMMRLAKLTRTRRHAKHKVGRTFAFQVPSQQCGRTYGKLLLVTWVSIWCFIGATGWCTTNDSTSTATKSTTNTTLQLELLAHMNILWRVSFSSLLGGCQLGLLVSWTGTTEVCTHRQFSSIIVSDGWRLLIRTVVMRFLSPPCRSYLSLVEQGGMITITGSLTATLEQQYFGTGCAAQTNRFGRRLQKTEVLC